MIRHQTIFSKLMLILSSIRGVFALSVVLLLATNAFIGNSVVSHHIACNRIHTTFLLHKSKYFMQFCSTQKLFSYKLFFFNLWYLRKLFCTTQMFLYVRIEKCCLPKNINLMFVLNTFPLTFPAYA